MSFAHFSIQLLITFLLICEEPFRFEENELLCMFFVISSSPHFAVCLLTLLMFSARHTFKKLHVLEFISFSFFCFLGFVSYLEVLTQDYLGHVELARTVK